MKYSLICFSFPEFKSKYEKSFSRIFIFLIGFMSFSDAQTLDLNSLRIAQKQAAKLKNNSKEISKIIK